MQSTPNIAIIIPAAGDSSRMGHPKQLLKWEHTTLLGHTIETALTINPSEVVVVLGAHYDSIMDSITHYPVSVLNNTHWESGLGSSIATALRYFLNRQPGPDGILIMLADQPFVDTKHLADLIEAFSAGEQQIIATTYQDGRKGVPALFDAVYFQELSRLYDDQGARQIIRQHFAKVKPIKLGEKAVDIDTEEDYKRLIGN